jgi:hypothetical protein
MKNYQRDLERLGKFTVKRDIQEFPIGNVFKGLINMRIKVMPEYANLQSLINEHTKMKQGIITLIEVFDQLSNIQDTTTITDISHKLESLLIEDELYSNEIYRKIVVKK